MTARARKTDESFTQYRKNLKKEHTKEQRIQKGKVFWDSDTKGTYVRAEKIVFESENLNG